MSEELGELVRKFKNRSLNIYYVLVFVVGFLGIWIPIFAVDTYLSVFLFIGLPVTVGYAFLLLIIYTMIREPVKKKLITLFSQVIIQWKIQAIEDTIKSIESTAPVPITNIETYSHDILNQRLRTEYPSLSLNKLGIAYPNTIDTLQKLLVQQPFLGTYYSVEQQFVKSFTDSSKHSLTLSEKS